MKTAKTTLGIVLTSISLGVAVAASQEHQHESSAPEKLGKVHFATSCRADAQPQFDRGVALLHSFWFPAAIDAFSAAMKKDPDCAIAYWGIALSLWGNPFGGSRSPTVLQDGLAAVEHARAAGARTERERAYIAAVEQLYRDLERLDQRTRTLAYEEAMRQLSRKYPEDREAAIFYALALDQTALPADKSYANQLKAAGILEQAFAEQPEHPGVAHYLIHTYDVPPLAARALAAARRYAKIAPSAPHALHMPSHTFTRVGYWQDSIDTNIASAAAAKKANSPAEQLHALDYQVYAYLQTAQDRAARRVLDELPAISTSFNPDALAAAAPGAAGLFALAAMPARYALERRAWAEAASLEVHPTRFPYIDAMTHFARSLGFARSGNAASARQDIERLAALWNALVQAKEAYWAEQVEIQRRVADAWAARAEGKTDGALALIRSAADLEDSTEKSAVTPGPLAPARELLGEMLVDSGAPAQALKEFEASAKNEPNRFRGVYGAARAAELSGDRSKAKAYYARLLEICKSADDPGRPELLEARNFVAQTQARR